MVLKSIDSLFIKWAPAINMSILVMISLIAFLVRVFSVIRYESIIHEFDPWFNYRTTQYLVKEGIYGLWNWFDSESWYPLGRSVGGTVYPGLMTTSHVVYNILHKMSLPVDIRNVCVFMAPVFAAFTAISTYLLTSLVTKRSEGGLYAALFMSIVPSYMSRSVAGSYDNEAVSIFALVFTFYVFLKAVDTGSLLWAAFSTLAYFYMVSAWGGYAFIINIIPIFVLFAFIMDLMTTNLYVAYSVFYILGTLLALQIPFVGFQAIHSSEHLASHGVFIFINVYYLTQFIKRFISKESFNALLKIIFSIMLIGLLIVFGYLVMSGKSKWSGRSMTLLDPTYAKKYIPIIASVSEHQATTWSSYFFDLHYLLVLSPVGLYYAAKKPNLGKIFCSLYVVLAVYFASVMVRLLLVLAPAVAVMGSIGISNLTRRLTKSIRLSITFKNKPKKINILLSFLGLIALCMISTKYIVHSNYAGIEAYSSPSIILSSRGRFGQRVIIDDYREAYYWLRTNTATDAKIMSWWDYGYQITGLSNRTVMVDNNTWNNTHIATVGLAMSSNEDDAYTICQKLDVDYVLVIFGGQSYYSGDDINKFLWMIRIAGGVYPWVKEEHYFSKGHYRIDNYASDTMRNSLMYRLSYYRFGQQQTAYGKESGYDTVRQQVVGEKNIQLKYFEEAFTSENWIVRIYKVKPVGNRDAFKILRKNQESLQTNQNSFKNYKYNSKIQLIKKKKVLV